MNTSGLTFTSRHRFRPSLGGLLVLFGMVVLPAMAANANAASTRIPLTADHWETVDGTTFTERDGRSVIEVTKGVAVLKDLTFRDGTIEYDIEALGPMGAGLGFRRRDDQTYEDFYLRPHAKCSEAPDCIQYAPETHGVLLWDMFPQYQSPAPLTDSGWQHIKMVISGRRMNIYVNHAASPSLTIGRLEGDTEEGSIFLEGPGAFANLTVTPDATDGLTPEPEKDSTDADNRYLRDWQMAPPTPFAADHQPSLSEVAGPKQEWRSVHAERNGVVNLSRIYGLDNGLDKSQGGARKGGQFIWLKTDLVSTKDQTKKVSLGWTRMVWIFVNGKQVFADKNLYQPPDARKNPDGRLSLENASFDLPLKKGKNVISVGLANNFYSWGVTMRLDDTNGLQLSTPANTMARK